MLLLRYTRIKEDKYNPSTRGRARTLHPRTRAYKLTDKHTYTHTQMQSLSFSHCTREHERSNLIFALQSEQLRLSDVDSGRLIFSQVVGFSFAEGPVLVKFNGKMLRPRNWTWAGDGGGGVRMDLKTGERRVCDQVSFACALIWMPARLRITARSKMALWIGIFGFKTSCTSPLRGPSALAPEWPVMRG